MFLNSVHSQVVLVVVDYLHHMLFGLVRKEFSVLEIGRVVAERLQVISDFSLIKNKSIISKYESSTIYQSMFVLKYLEEYNWPRDKRSRHCIVKCPRLSRALSEAHTSISCILPPIDRDLACRISRKISIYCC